MWVFMNDAFVSVVQHWDDADKLMVRARCQGDLERVFPDRVADVHWSPTNDYLFRVVVTRPEFDAAMLRETRRIDYPNFKGSVQENDRHDAYMAVWSAMHRLQSTRRMIALPVVNPPQVSGKRKGK